MKSRLKWRLVSYEFDPELYGQISGVLHAYEIYNSERGLTCEELAALFWDQEAEDRKNGGWSDEALTMGHKLALQEAEEWRKQGEQDALLEMEEHERLLCDIVANPRKHLHYADLGAFVNGDGKRIWVWFTQLPKSPEPYSPKIHHILKKIKTQKTVTEIAAARKAREADPEWQAEVLRRRNEENYTG